MILFGATDFSLAGLLLGVAATAIAVGTPYLFVSLGECITEKSGRVNLGLEGTLVMGAMTAYAVSFLTGAVGLTWWLPQDAASAISGSVDLTYVSPWLGVLAAGCVGMLLGALHGVICNLPKVNAVAVGIAMMIFGSGLAAYLGKAFVGPQAQQLPKIDFGAWSDNEQLKIFLKISPLFLVGVALAPFLAWMMQNTRWGLTLRLAGESEEAAAAMGYSVAWTRVIATATGGFLAGVGGSFLSLSLVGVWKDDISSGQGLMAIALVIFARWKPIYCLLAALLFGGIGSIGSSLQSYGLSSADRNYLWGAAPYVLTLAILILTSSRARAMAGAPAELTRVR